MKDGSAMQEFRREYRLGALHCDEELKDPFILFRGWFESAAENHPFEPNAFSLSTCGADGQPRCRTLLLKAFDSQGFLFFTNYNSRKGLDLRENPKASMLFYWASQERQVRIEGKVTKLDGPASDEYFIGRPRKAQVGACVSRQSSELDSRVVLERAVDEFELQLGDNRPSRPEWWGGYKLNPEYFEFWQGRESRLHDRLVFRRSTDSWKKNRLWP